MAASGRKQTAAVVVLYRPDSSVLDNVASYLDQVDRVYAVDNSEEPDSGFEARLGSLGKVTHLALGANLGIARALNEGARAALAEGYSWLLTMDQDSTATPHLVQELAACMDTDPRIALVSPVHHQVGMFIPKCESGCRDVLTAMTSGNLVRLQAWQAVGGFMEELFIDSVDDEFCLRLQQAGFRVVESGGTLLHHRLGKMRRHRFPWPCWTFNHSALRRYYITRNRLVVGTRYRSAYPHYWRMLLVYMAKDVAKILLYEEEKVQKITMMLRGVRDFMRGVLGPCPGA